jgi:K+-sensing histidine kinase KdpD
MRRIVHSYQEHSRWGYVIAVLASVLALIVTMYIWPPPTDVRSEAPPFVLSGFVALLCALYLGQGPGLLATLIVALVHAWYFYPADSLIVARHSDLIRLCLFVTQMTLISLMSGARGRADSALILLSKAGAVLASTLDHQTILERGAGLPLPMLGDFAAIYLVDPEGKIEQVVAAHADQGKAELARQFSFQLPDLDRDVALAAVIRSASPDVQNQIDTRYRESTSASAAESRLKQELGMKSRLIVPLVARGHILGALSIHRNSWPAFGPRDIDLGEELGRRIAVAVDNAVIFRDAQGQYKLASVGKLRF